MTDIDKLIQLNVEIEGLLRVVLDRDSDEAKALLAQKYADFERLMARFLGNDTEEPEPLKEPEPVIEPAKEPEPVKEPGTFNKPLSHINVNTILKAFTLNDKFRYIREVFGGNERDFNDTVAILADMDTFDDAREYLIGDMMLNPDAPAVADFLELVKRNIDV